MSFGNTLSVKYRRILWAAAIVAIVLSSCLMQGTDKSEPQPEPEPEPEPELDWACTPINPLSQAQPDNPCFRALLSMDNRVTLQWRVVSSEQRVYLYDCGPAYQDIGFQPAVCPLEPETTCSTSFRVSKGGFYCWQLKASDSPQRQTHVTASIIIPEPFPPRDVSGGGLVDLLAPTSQTVSWSADQRNAAFDESVESAWIELRHPRSFYWSSTHYSRSGPGASFTVPESMLNKPGQVVYSIRDCRLPNDSRTKLCSQGTNIGFHVGTDRFLGEDVIHTEAGKSLEIAFTNNSGDVRLLSSATLTPVPGGLPVVATTGSSYTIDASLLTPGEHKIELFSCMLQDESCSTLKKFESTRAGDELTVLVNSPVDWVLGREYTKDFYPGVAHKVLGSGDPLDISYDSRGGLWLINEFSNSIEHVSPVGITESFTIPLARKPQFTPGSSAAVKPFAFAISGSSPSPVNISMLAERATSVGSKVWFTQGGGMLGTTTVKNHSRVISFDQMLSDSPTTPYDDRICVYNIPTDDEARVGNNQVIGLTATTNRIWIGESRGFFDEEPSVISSFIPDPDNCGNLLNFEDPDMLANQRMQYCGEGVAPEQGACIEKFLLTDMPPGLKVAHLATDPLDGSVWFTDARGGYLGNMDSDGDGRIKIFPLPDDHSNRGMFGGFPWSIRVDRGAVYIGEYSTRHILRFDKASATFDEIYIPGTNARTPLHSLDVDFVADRLWFTITNESAAPLNRVASTIGYIDLASWRAHVASPGGNERVLAVIYKGLDSIAISDYPAIQHQAFRGIAVDPKTGKIGLATMRRKQITELTPLANFWP